MSADSVSREEFEEVFRLVEALQRKLNVRDERINELESDVDRLNNRVVELENLVDPDPGHANYGNLGKDEKVWRVRKKLAEMAATRNGKQAMSYRDVMMLFNGHPSAGHCYNLMERAGELDGFEYDANPEGEKRLTVNLDGVNDERVIHSVKKGFQPEAA